MKSGEESSQRQAVEQAILRQIETYGMTTRSIWNRTPVLQACPPSVIARTIRSLGRRRIIESHPLYHGRFYFTFTKVTAQKQLLESTTGGPFSEPHKFNAYARLLIGVSVLPGSVPLLGEQRRSILPVGGYGLSNSFMLNKQEKRLYFFRIDNAIQASPARSAQKLRNDVFRLAKLPAIKSLFKDQRFELVLVTCTANRGKAIMKHFSNYARVGCTPVRTIVLPELIPLVTSIPIGGAIAANTK